MKISRLFFHIPIPIPGISGFFTRDFFGIFHSRSPGYRDFLDLTQKKTGSGFGIPEKSHPEANSLEDDLYLYNVFCYNQ